MPKMLWDVWPLRGNRIREPSDTIWPYSPLAFYAPVAQWNRAWFLRNQRCRFESGRGQI